MSVAPEPALRLDTRRLARLGWRHRGRLLRWNGAVAVLAVGAVLLLPRWYRSGVTLVPAPQDGLNLDLGGAGVPLAGPSISLGAGPTPQDQLRMVVASRAVADSLIRRFELQRAWKLRRLEKARERLADLTVVTTPKQGQVVVEVEARTPALARDLAAGYADYAGREAARLKTSLARQRRTYLEQRLAELETEIAAAADRVRGFETRHRAAALSEQTRETLDAAATLQAQRALLETELEPARRFFTEQSPEVIALRERVAALDRQSERLARDGGRMFAKGDELPALKQEYLRLTREQASLTAVSELLRRAYEQARVEEANPVPSFSLLDDAELPERHSRPARGLTVALATSLSLAASLSILYFRWRPWRGRLRRPAPRRDAGGALPPLRRVA